MEWMQVKQERKWMRWAWQKDTVDKRQESSMIPSARPTFPPWAITWNLFCSEIFWKVSKCVKIVDHYQPWLWVGWVDQFRRKKVNGPCTIFSQNPNLIRICNNKFSIVTFFTPISFYIPLKLTGLKNSTAWKRKFLMFFNDSFGKTGISTKFYSVPEVEGFCFHHYLPEQEFRSTKITCTVADRYIKIPVKFKVT